MRIRFVLAAAVLLGSICAITLQARSEGTGGKDLFLQYKCNRCHTVDVQKITRDSKETDEEDASVKKPPDLSTVGQKRTAQWVVGWLNRDELLDGKKHRKKWTGTPEEAQAIAEWLAGLK